LRLPDASGIEATTRLHKEFASPKVIIISSYDGEEDIYRSFQAGARGYLLKDASQEEILDAIRRVNLGETYLPARIVQQVAEGFRKPEISPRELEVLQGVAAGKSNKEIGVQLFISEGTVKSHVKSLLERQCDAQTQVILRLPR